MPLYALAELGYEAPDTARQYAVNLVGEFAKALRLPSPIAFSAWTTPDSANDSLAVPTIANEASVTIGLDGRLVDLALTQSSLVASVDSAVLAAVRLALGSGGVLPPSVHAIHKPLTMYVGLRLIPPSRQQPPPEPEPAERPVIPLRRTVQIPVRLLDLPVKRFSRLAKIDEKRLAPANYPADLGRARWDGDVDLEYVVGDGGVVIANTIRVIGGTERRFAAAAIEGVKGTGFIPAEIDGCPVSMLVRQRYSFRSGRR
jgi:TonB family protein